MTLYDGNIITNVQKAYEKATQNYSVYQIDGALLDSMIFVSPNCKTTILKEHYLNEWSSCYTMRQYNTTPKKYKQVIELLENGEQEKATQLFYK